MKKAIKGVFTGELSFFVSTALGALCGLSFGFLFCGKVDAPAFAGGFAHAFPGSFTPRAVAFAILFQALPMLLIYYGGYGVLTGETSCLVLSFRAMLGGYCTIAAAKIGDPNDPLFVVLFVLFVLFELLTISLHASFAHLSMAFSRVIVRKRTGRAIKKFTRDFLFFYGMILFFYLARGCIVALMNL